jgi:hypothetical protein
MSQKTHMQAREAFFDRYRRIIQQHKDLSEQITELDRDYEHHRRTLMRDQHKMDQEISRMRGMITAMIDNGWDPTEAQLKMSEQSDWETVQEANLWTQNAWDRHQNTATSPFSGTTTASLNDLSLGTMGGSYTVNYPHGAIGAIGSMGSISMGATGANGPAPIGGYSNSSGPLGSYALGKLSP